MRFYTLIRFHLTRTEKSKVEVDLPKYWAANSKSTQPKSLKMGEEVHIQAQMVMVTNN